MSDEERDYDAEAYDRDDYEHDRMVEDRLEAKAPVDRGPHPSRRPGLDIEQEISNIKARGLSPADEKRELYGANLVKYTDQAKRTQRHREGN